MIKIANLIDAKQAQYSQIISEKDTLKNANKDLVAAFYKYASGSLKKDFRAAHEQGSVSNDYYKNFISQVKAEMSTDEIEDFDAYSKVIAFENNMNMIGQLENIEADYKQIFAELSDSMDKLRDSIMNDADFDMQTISAFAKQVSTKTIGLDIFIAQFKVDRTKMTIQSMVRTVSEHMFKEFSSRPSAGLLGQAFQTGPTHFQLSNMLQNEQMNIVTPELAAAQKEMDALSNRLETMSREFENGTLDVEAASLELAIADIRITSANMTVMTELISEPIARDMMFRTDMYKNLPDEIKDSFKRNAVDMQNIQQVFGLATDMLKKNNTVIDSAVFGKALSYVATAFSQQQMKITNMLYNGLSSMDSIFKTKEKAYSLWSRVTSLGFSDDDYNKTLKEHGDFFNSAIKNIANSTSFMDSAVSDVISRYEDNVSVVVEHELRIEDMSSFGYKNITALDKAFKDYTRQTMVSYCLTTAIETVGLIAVAVLTTPVSGGTSAVAAGTRVVSIGGKFVRVVKGLNLGARIHRAATMALTAGTIMSGLKVGTHNISELIKEGFAEYQASFDVLENIGMPLAQGFNQGKWLGLFMGGIGGISVTGRAGLSEMFAAGLKENAGSLALNFGKYFTLGSGARAIYGISKEYFVEGKGLAEINYRDVLGDSVGFGLEAATLLTLGNIMGAGAKVQNKAIMQEAAAVNITESDIIGKTWFKGIGTYGRNLALKADAIEALSARTILAEHMFNTANVLVQFNMWGKAAITPAMDAWRSFRGKDFIYKMLAGFGEGGAADSWTQGAWFGVPFAFASAASAAAENAWVNITKDMSVTRFVGKIKTATYDKLWEPAQYFIGGTIKESFIEGPVANLLTQAGVPSFISETLVEFIPGGAGGTAAVFSYNANIATIETVDRNAALEMAANTPMTNVVNSGQVRQIITIILCQKLLL